MCVYVCVCVCICVRMCVQTTNTVCNSNEYYILIIYGLISLPGLLTGLCSGCLEENFYHFTLDNIIADSVQLRVKMQ